MTVAEEMIVTDCFLIPFLLSLMSKSYYNNVLKIISLLKREYIGYKTDIGYTFQVNVQNISVS